MLRRATSVGALILAAALVLPTAALAGPMTPGERQRLVAHLEMTESWLASELDGLSDAQLTFKMTPESWSIKDVAEHLAIAEPQYWTNLEASLQGAGEGRVEAGGHRRADALVRHRPHEPPADRRGARAARPVSRAPRRRWRRSASCARRCSRRRRTSQEDFRGRAFMGGGQDVYQWFLMISTHSQRHILQIREIKAHPNYPKK